MSRVLAAVLVGLGVVVAGAMVVVAVFFAVAQTGSTTASGSESPTGSIDGSTPYVVAVSGSGTASARPDVVDIQLGVESISSDAAQAIRENSDRVTAVVAALRDSGAEEKDIQTAEYRMWVEQVYDRDGPTGEVRYHVVNQMRVRLRDLDKTGAILQGALEAGANNVGGIAFSVDDTAGLRSQARGEAIADARAKAEQLARELGVTLAGVRQVSEVAGAPPGLITRNFAFDSVAMEQPAAREVPVSSGEFNVTVAVQLVFDIAR